MKAETQESVRRAASAIVTVLGIAASVYHLYAAYWYPLFALQHRALHLLFMGTILFLVHTVLKEKRLTWPKLVYTLVFVGLTIAATSYVLINYDSVATRAGAYNRWDIAFGIMMLLVVFEGARRGTGWPIVIVAAAFFVFAFVGPYLPAILAHRGFPLQRTVPFLYLTTEGIFGIPLGVSAKFVLLFILYGAILERTGAGKFFLDLAMAVAGNTRGGPAKAAVLSSTVMGTMSGSSVANVTTTGTFTIPLMKRIGIKPEAAGGIEASASSMGQITPPVMGAAAFLLAEYIGVPYLTVVIAAIIPALLAFYSMFVQVDFMAAVSGLRGIPRPDLPRLGQVLREGGYFLLPLIVLFYFLLRGYSPERAVFWTILFTMAIVIVVGWRRGQLKETLGQLVQALRDGGVNTVEVAIICAAAGIIIGVTTMTGLGLRLSGIVVDLAGGQLWLAAPLAAVSSLILGMGIPTTANYVIQATLVAPAFVAMGVPILSAHLFVFYFGVIADMTPPVALAAFAASGIAQSDPFRTGLEAFRFGMAKYAVPFLFLTNPALLLQGSPGEIILSVMAAVLGITALGGVLQRYFFGAVRPWQVILLLVATAAMFSMQPRFWVLGLALMALVAATQWRTAQAARSTVVAG
ncbi:MAG TPA: TRAP transporter permease [Limnochordales bacterium]|nr:TRAP transporter permease [Limnochordales bacterium]